eukprot:337062-Hanusia_phi.AAC.1
MSPTPIIGSDRPGGRRIGSSSRTRDSVPVPARGCQAQPRQSRAGPPAGREWHWHARPVPDPRARRAI